MEVNIPVSLGELLDKISILEIKNKKILNESKLSNIKKELSGLKNVLKELDINMSKANDLYEDLYKINLSLWEIEDSIRLLEKNESFGKDFVKLARSVYITNDKRFEVKNKINKLFQSQYIEEKSYEDY
tara:strand:- start:122 stop:508 length:387 start_codon:yes stop_codon:yes gene_type:complete